MKNETPKPNQASSEPPSFDLFKVLGDVLQPLKDDKDDLRN